MTTKRDAMLAVLAGGASLAAATLSPPARAESSVSEADANEALQGWIDALFDGTPAAVEKVLAPEYQILRSDGVGYTKAEYLNVLPKQKSKSKVANLVTTAHGDTLVLRYVLETDQTISGKPVQSIAPRLSVFRKDAAGWLIVAHSNFAKIE